MWGRELERVRSKRKAKRKDLCIIKGRTYESAALKLSRIQHVKVVRQSVTGKGYLKRCFCNSGLLIERADSRNTGSYCSSRGLRCGEEPIVYFQQACFNGTSVRIHFLLLPVYDDHWL